MHNTYLRRLRSRWLLSQGELAELLDVNQGRVSRYEKGEEYPTLAVVLGLQVVFGSAPSSLVAPLYENVEEAVMGRAATFERRLAGKTDPVSERKQQLLTAMMHRVTKRSGA